MAEVRLSSLDRFLHEEIDLRSVASSQPPQPHQLHLSELARARQSPLDGSWIEIKVCDEYLQL